jgi:uncharacterized protein (TIGR03435 family)
MLFKYLLFAICSIVLVTPSGSLASQNSKKLHLVYEVSVVKPSPLAQRGWMVDFTANGFTARGVSVRQLIVEAYGLQDQKQLLNLPSWVDSSKFDIDAKVSPEDFPAYKGLSYDDKRHVLQSLIEERFQLKFHDENKMISGYYLLFAKVNGSKKLERSHKQEGEDESEGLVRVSRRGHLEVESMSLDRFAHLLQGVLGQPVENETGNTERFDLKLAWRTDDQDGSGENSSQEASIFTALKDQLGLQLKAGPVKTREMVIDSIARPSEN